MDIRGRQRLCVLLVLFLGYLGYSLVFPILPPMFLGDHLILPDSTSYQMRNILLGCAFAMYPMGQFIGCPVLGKLSDKYGRRPVLNISLLITSLMYVFTALAVSLSSVTILFLARFITGLFEGNITTANAVMADISASSDEKTRNFGWIMTFSSSGWVIGPLVGGKLADPNIVSWFTFSTPFWIAAFILFLSFLLVYFTFNESNQHKSSAKLSIRFILSSMIHAARVPHLKRLYCVNALFYLATFLFFTYLPVWLIKLYSYTASGIGNLEAYLSIVICLAPFSYTAFSKRLHHKWTLAIASMGLATSFIPFLLIKPEFALWITIIPVSYFIALGLSFASILISDLTTPAMQGEALGVNQSVMVFSEMIVGLLGGFLVAAWLPLPFVAAILLSFAAATLMIFTRFSVQANR